MIESNRTYVDREDLPKYAEAIRHFRGYIDRERFEDDIAFLRQFVAEMSASRTSPALSADSAYVPPTL